MATHAALNDNRFSALALGLSHPASAVSLVPCALYYLGECVHCALHYMYSLFPKTSAAYESTGLNTYVKADDL